MIRTLLTAGLIAATILPAAAMAQGRGRMNPDVLPALDNVSKFKCDGGRVLNISFSSGDSEFFVIADAGDGPHVLPVQPWEGNIPKVTWSDGKRTLTWTTGVHLMWMDGATHLDCARSGGEHEH